MKTDQQLNTRKAEQFWSKIWQPRDITKKPMDKQHGKRIRRT